jgi:hypothetical protein
MLIAILANGVIPWPLVSKIIDSHILPVFFEVCSILASNMLLTSLSGMLMLSILSWWLYQLRHSPEIVPHLPSQTKTRNNVWEEVLDISVWHRTSLQFMWYSEDLSIPDVMLEVVYRLRGDVFRPVGSNTWIKVVTNPFGVVLPLKQTSEFVIHIRVLGVASPSLRGTVVCQISSRSLRRPWKRQISLDTKNTPERREVSLKPPEEPWEEGALLAAVNHWWQEGARDRRVLQALLAKIGLAARFYALTDLASTTAQVETPFSFEASDDTGGWLWWQPLGEREALALPADPTYFVTHQVMGLVRRMFEGFVLETLPTPMRFYKAYRACRLRAVPEQHGKFTLDCPGYIQLFPGEPAPQHIVAPPSYATIMEQQQASRARTPAEQLSHAKPAPFVHRRARTMLSPTPQDIMPPIPNAVPSVLETRLQQMSVAIGESQRSFSLLETSLQQISQRLERVELQSLQNRAAEQELRRVRDALQSLDKQIDYISRRLETIEQPQIMHNDRTTTTDQEDRSSIIDGIMTSKNFPMSWAEPMEVAFTTSGGQQADTQNPLAPQHYVKRLRHLLEAFRRMLDDSPQYPHTVEIVHLALDEIGFRMHRTSYTEEDEGQGLFCRQCNLFLEGRLVFQAFLGIESLDDTTLWLFLPLGSFSRDNFPRGFQRLLEESPSGLPYITEVRQPAQLRNIVTKSGDLYRVIVKMQVQYAHT